MQNSKLPVKNDNYLKLSLKDVPIEGAHGGSGKRQMLLRNEHVASPHWEAVTKGFLEAGGVFDWHNHEYADEVFIVLKGNGKYYCGNDETDYTIDDVFITPAPLKHKIEAQSESEYYFIRVKT